MSIVFKKVTNILYCRKSKEGRGIYNSRSTNCLNKELSRVKIAHHKEMLPSLVGRVQGLLSIIFQQQRYFKYSLPFLIILIENVNIRYSNIDTKIWFRDLRRRLIFVEFLGVRSCQIPAIVKFCKNEKISEVARSTFLIELKFFETILKRIMNTCLTIWKKP